MEIGERYNIVHDLGGGGWERSGVLSWKRSINGKTYQFQAYWEPDNRGVGLDHMWSYFIIWYDVATMNEKGYRIIRLFEGYPTGGIDKSREADLLPLSETQKTGKFRKWNPQQPLF